MKNKLLNKKKIAQLFYLFTFLVLVANTAVGQLTYTWTGAANNDWTNQLNWSKSSGTLYPGQGTGDVVVIGIGGTPTLAGASLAIARMTISNAAANASSTLNISSDATLTLTSSTTNVVTLNGGRIVNNGILSITCTATAAPVGILCGTPSPAATLATDYGYSGSGTLTINVSAATSGNSVAIQCSSANALATYRMAMTSANTTFTLSSAGSSFAFRAAGGATSSTLIIDGTGLRLGTSGSRVSGGLLFCSSGGQITVESTATLELNSISTNITPGINLYQFSATTAIGFTNRGTINILGDTATSGIAVNIGSGNASVLTNANINASNVGTINVDINATAASSAALVATTGGAVNITSVVTFTNSGTFTLKNSAFNGSTIGFSMLGSSAGQRTVVVINNSGTLNIDATIQNSAQGFTINNTSSGIVNSNSNLASFTGINNSAAGTYNFTRSSAVLTFAANTPAATAGTTYTDTNSNVYTVITTKVSGTGTQMLAVVDPGSTTTNTTIATSGTLTRFGAATGDSSLVCTGIAVQSGGMISPSTNLGTINTGAAAILSNVSGVTTGSTGVIDPGGASRRGIADFATAGTPAISSTLRLQIAANGTAGVNFDRITNSVGGFSLTNARLDVTSIYTPVANTTIDIVTVPNGQTISGNFTQIVTALSSGWAVQYVLGTVNARVYLEYTAPVAGTITSAATGLWSVGSTWVGGIAPAATDNVIIGSNHTVTISGTAVTRNSGTTTTVNAGCTLATSVQYTNNGTTTINGAFQLNTSGFTSGSSFVYGASGTLNFNSSTSYGVGNTDPHWPSTSGPVNVTILQGGITLNTTRTVSGIFQTAAGVTNANNLTATGTLQLNTGGFVSGSPTYGGSSTLIYNTGSTFGRGAEWTTAQSGAGYPTNVQIGNGTATILNVVNSSASYRRAAGNLTVSTGSTLSIADLNTGNVGLEFLGNIINDGTITLSGTTNSRLKGANFTNGSTNTTATTTLAANNGADLELTGNYVDNATFTANSRAVFFTGTGTQTISGTASAPFNIDYMVVTKASGTVQLSVNLLTGAPNGGSGLTLSTATDILNLNGRTFTLGTAGTACTVSGSGLIRSTSGSLVINGTGALGTLTFESGNNTLAGLTIDRTTGTGTPGVTLGSALNVTTTLALTSTSTLTLGGTLAVSAAGNNTVAGIIAGASALTKTGAGTLTLSGVNTYSGTTTINAGAVSVTTSSNLGGGAVALGGGTLNAAASFNTGKSIVLTASTTSTIDVASGTATASGIISGSGSLTKTGTGTLLLSGNNSYSGTTTVSAGTINRTLTGISSTAFTPTTQSVTFTTTAPSNGAYQLFNGPVSGTQSFSSNAAAGKVVSFNYTSGAVSVSSTSITATLTNSPQTFDGSQIAAVISANSGGTQSNVRYDGSTTVPTNVGTYAILVDVAANGSYEAGTNVSAGNFIINKATPTLSISGTPTTFGFTGNAQGPTVSVTNNSGGTQTFAYTSTDGGGYSQNSAPSAAGAYQVTVSVGSTGNYNAAGPSNAVAFTISTTTAWNGSSWSFGTPTALLDAVINGAYNTGAGGLQLPFSAKSLTINSPGTLTIATGNNVTVANAIVNNNANSITVENNANLVQTAVANTNSGTGTAIVKRNSNYLKRLDYTLWSSPVAVSGSKTLSAFSPLTTQTPTSVRFYTYNPSTNLYNAATVANRFDLAKGYLIRMPDQDPDLLGNDSAYYRGEVTLDYKGEFTGTLNNGTIAVNDLASDKFHAVGNPYPSTINAASFLGANSTGGMLYFWRKTNGVANTNSSYATWTTVGGTVASTTAPNNVEPDGTIAVGQGFIVKTGVGITTLNFTNEMRTSSNSAKFFKTKKEADKSRVWLNLSGAAGAFSQALIGYVEGATNGVDNGIDGKSFGDGEIELSSSIDGESYTIQGRPAFDANDIVSLNFKTSIAGTYTIAIDHVDGLFSRGQDIYLVDKTAETTTNLNEGAYTFTAAVGVDNTRFTLTYQKTLKVDAPVFNENSVLVSKSNGTINVKSTAVAINNVKVYDIQGRLVAERKNVKSNTATISNVRATQVLIVKVTAENNAVVTKKVLN